MIMARIPFDFVKQRAELSWRDVAYALDRQLTSPRLAIELAQQRVSTHGTPAPDEYRLAESQPADPIRTIVESLAETAEPDHGSAAAKWLYLLLAWVFVNRTAFDDPLGMVEQIYADFDYPEEVAPFVRYMPMVGPDLGSTDRNEARLYQYWEQYLDSAARRFHAER